jgi:hypothetical protein
MHVEFRIVSIDFIHKHFRIVVARRQDFHLQGSGFVFQTAGSVRHRRRDKLIPASRRDFNRSDECKFGYARSPSLPCCLDQIG